MSAILFPVERELELPRATGLVGVGHDERNREFRALVSPPEKTDSPGRAWYSRDVFDQGNDPRCVVDSGIGVLRTSPFRSQFSEYKQFDDPDERHSLYLTCKDNDAFEGNAYDGSSTEAVFRVLRNMGVISGWQWLFGEEELRYWLTHYGPASVGTVWPYSAFNVDRRGYLEVDTAGPIAGGHAYRIAQYSIRRRAYRKIGSWSRSWGDKGRAWIRQEDMAWMLEQNGEAVTIA